MSETNFSEIGEPKSLAGRIRDLPTYGDPKTFSRQITARDRIARGVENVGIRDLRMEDFKNIKKTALDLIPIVLDSFDPQTSRVLDYLKDTLVDAVALIEIPKETDPESSERKKLQIKNRVSNTLFGNLEIETSITSFYAKRISQAAEEFRKQNPDPINDQEAEKCFTEVEKLAGTVGLDNLYSKKIKEEILQSWRKERYDHQKNTTILKESLGQNDFEEIMAGLTSHDVLNFLKVAEEFGPALSSEKTPKKLRETWKIILDEETEKFFERLHETFVELINKQTGQIKKNDPVESGNHFLETNDWTTFYEKYIKIFGYSIEESRAEEMIDRFYKNCFLSYKEWGLENRKPLGIRHEHDPVRGSESWVEYDVPKLPIFNFFEQFEHASYRLRRDTPEPDFT